MDAGRAGAAGGDDEKVPCIAVLGGREMEAGTVSVRRRGGGEAAPEPQAAFVARLRMESDSRAAV
jgi:threonyl-tRNA synthetase